MLSVMQSVLMTQNICQAAQSFDHQGNLVKADGAALQGEVLTTSEAQTITNKTISSGTITGTVSMDTSGRIKTSGTVEVTSNGGIVVNTGTARPCVVSENQAQQIMQHGFAAGNGTNALTVTFSVAFSTAPTVVISGFENSTTYNNNLRVNAINVTATGFEIRAGGNVTAPEGFYWIAMGPK